MIVIVLSLFSIYSQAAWVGTLDRAGFFGKFSAGVIYELTEKHQLAFSVGTYTLENNDYFQLNAAYRYSPWQTVIYGHIWDPAQFGIFVIHSLDQNRYFYSSPSTYPSPGYYDETSIRWGLEYGTCIAIFDNKFELAYRLRIVDSGMIALINNAHRDLQYYAASGLALHYRF